MRVAPLIQLSPNDRTTLEQMARGRRTPVRLVLRAKIVLLAAEGLENREIAARVNASKPTVGLWRARYAKLGLAGIEKDASRPGRPRKDRRDLEQRIVQMTTQEKPRNATHWSTRSLAAVLKIDHVLVHRVWRAHGLLPHRVRSFKLSKDKNFVKKLVDVVGLYLNPRNMPSFSAPMKNHRFKRSTVRNPVFEAHHQTHPARQFHFSRRSHRRHLRLHRS